MAMSLLRNTDPHYWLAKVAATSPKDVYTKDEYKKAVTGVVQMYQVALEAAQDALGHSGVAVFGQGDVDAVINPLVRRGDLFIAAYSANLQTSADTVTAPSLRDDCIEFLVYITAAYDQLIALASWSTSWTDWIADIALSWSNGAQAIFAALAGTIQAVYAALSTTMQLLIWTVGIGGSGLLVYGGYRWIRVNTSEKTLQRRRRIRASAST